MQAGLKIARITKCKPVKRDDNGLLQWAGEHDLFVWSGMEAGQRTEMIGAALCVDSSSVFSRYMKLKREDALRWWETPSCVASSPKRAAAMTSKAQRANA